MMGIRERIIGVCDQARVVVYFAVVQGLNV
jgi:hypothetical protein